MTATTRHTPTPWTLQAVETAHNGYSDWPTFAIRSPANVCLAIVGEVDRYQSERINANARLIVTAVNAHAETLALLRGYLTTYPHDSYSDRTAALLATLTAKDND